MTTSPNPQIPRLPRINRLALKAAATVVLLGFGAAHADVVTLNNGDRITGVVGNITSGNVTVTTAYAGLVTIGMANVTNIETDGSYDVTLNSGDQVSGQLVSDGLLINGSVTPTTLADISLLAPPPSDAPVWTSRIDALFSLSTGNSETQSINLLGDSLYTSGRNEHHLRAYWADEEADSVTTKSQTEIDYGYRRYLRDNWFVGGSLEYYQDELKDIDYRFTVGATAGKLFWDNAVGRFSVEAGVSQVFEKLGGLDGSTESNPALRWALNYNRFVQAKTEVFHNHEILAILGGGRGQIFNSSTGVRYALSDSISATARIDLRHETDPPIGADKTDVTYGVGVGYLF